MGIERDQQHGMDYDGMDFDGKWRYQISGKIGYKNF